MALNTYSGLQASVANFLARTDLDITKQIIESINSVGFSVSKFQ